MKERKLDYTDDIYNKCALIALNSVLSDMNKRYLDIVTADDYSNAAISKFRRCNSDKIRDLIGLKNVSEHLIGAMESEAFYMLSCLLNARDKIATTNVSTYIVYNESNNLYKIGKTKDIDSRIKQIQLGTGAKLKIILLINSNVESELHKEFEDCRIHGEWFRLSELDIRYMSERFNKELLRLQA